MIRIGYAGVNTELPSAGKTFRLSGYSEERMLEVSRGNIEALGEILRWNDRHGIRLFRITSNLIPFGSHPVNSGSWKRVFRRDFENLGYFIRESGMRVSMHPGQHTVLNTPDDRFFESVLKDLEYHDAVMSLMGLGRDNVIVVHGGGGYGDRTGSLRRLRSRINGLPDRYAGRLALENDDRVFTASVIHALCRQTGLPGILDVFHHEVLPSCSGTSTRELIIKFATTWGGFRQKIHYSDQDPDKRKGSHSQSVNVSAFGTLLETIGDLELDIMLEAKDKQASVLALREAYPELK
ncbi:MAG TPA: UV DNA damage repair endonuclease UvsE [Deltaproteobacteria bacterium]|nr:UV DNA damage repair endonuclease UvsE [Deltaproteobacteria bacterium]HOI07683.1 UV DNA damage repair endonuclease UvsE [Deltaproteobacteria bacterium]